MPDLKITELQALPNADNPETYFIVSLDGQSLKLRLDTLKNFTQTDFNIYVAEALQATAVKITNTTQEYADSLVVDLENDIVDAVKTSLLAEATFSGTTPTNLSALIDTLSQAAVSASGEFATAIDYTGLSTALNDQAASVTQTLQSYATNDHVGAIASVVIDVDGRITGWTAVDSTSTEWTNASSSGSAFLIQADNFAIANSDPDNPSIPFNIQSSNIAGEPDLISFNGKVAFTNVTGTTDLLKDITDLDVFSRGLVVVFSGLDHTEFDDGVDQTVKIDDIYIEATTETSTDGNTVDVINTWKCTDGTAGAVTWNQINSNDNLTSLADLADGKRTIFSNASDDAPYAELNDIWIPTTGTNDTTYVPGSIYQYTAAGDWAVATRYTDDSAVTELGLKVVEAVDIANAVNSNSTTIDGASITTGSIGAAHIIVSGEDSLTPGTIGVGSDATSGSRMNITSTGIEVWEGTTLRVKLGLL